MTESPAESPSRKLPLLVYVALFAGALYAEWSRCGGSAHLWVDTLEDERTIQRCLNGLGCNFSGIGSSVPRFVNPSGWLHLRIALDMLGLSIDGAHVATVVGNALAAVLVAYSADRLGGRLAAVIAVFFYALLFVPWDVGNDVLFNSSPMRFAGAVFLTAQLNFLTRPRMREMAVAAMTAAAMAGIYASSTPAVVSLALIALRAPESRLRFAVAGAAVFGAFEYVMTPAGSISNVQALLTKRPDGGTPPNSGIPQVEDPVQLMFEVALAVSLVWLVSAVILPRLRRQLDGPLSVLVPPLAVLAVAAFTGAAHGTEKYVSHAGPALCVAAALPIAFALEAIWGGGRAITRVTQAIAVIVTMLTTARWVDGKELLRPLNPDEIRFAEVAGASKFLAAGNWTWDKAVHRLQTPSSRALWAARYFLPEGPEAAGGLDATVLFAPTDRLPKALPAGWSAVAQVGDRTTVVIPTKSWLDWRTFQICSGTPVHCVDSARDVVGANNGHPSAVRGLPEFGRTPVAMRFRVPVVPPGAGATERITAVNPVECSGKVVSIEPPETGSEIDPDGLAATLIAPDGGPQPSSIVLEWNVGGPDCPNPPAGESPPFVLEGDVRTVEAIEGLWPEKTRP